MTMKLQRHELHVVSCWQYAAGKIYAEIGHDLQGLPEGLLICSPDCSRKWSIAGRVWFSHTNDRQIEFMNEYQERVMLKFSSAEKREESRARILMLEKQHIFLYSLLCLDHNEKMTPGQAYFTEMLVR